MNYSIVTGDFSSLETPGMSYCPRLPPATSSSPPSGRHHGGKPLSSNSELLLLAVQRDTEVVGIVPLMCNGQRMSFIGSSDVCDYMDFVIRSGQEVAVLSKASRLPRTHGLEVH